MISAKYKKKYEDLILVCRKNIRHLDENLVFKAYEFAWEAHKNNIRASGEPFFDHPYSVAMILANEIPLDDISIASALLHDVVEDTDFELKDIKAEFGEKVAEIVDGVTKIKDIPHNIEKSTIEGYRKLLLSMVNDIRVILIKFADRLHNMRTLEYLSPEKQFRMAKETLDIYTPLANRFGLANIKWEMEDLALKYTDRKTYEEIARNLNIKRDHREKYIREFIKPIEDRLKKEGFTFEIYGRPKHIFSIYNKIVKRKVPFEEMFDLFAIRVIVDEPASSSVCYTVYSIVSEIYNPIPEKFKDYIVRPKKNGYQSLHTVVIGPGGRMAEVQIRTREMHEIAERGVASHWKYKENTQQFAKDMEEWVLWVREFIEQIGDEESSQFLESFKLNLFQDEIYVFTPKGDLKVLPKGATPVDFAFEVHSQVGYRCIGAKVNGKIVPLNTTLSSGDQLEIITSKNQKPNKDWELFVVTSKAKSHIRRWINDEKRQLANLGKELWEKKLKKLKLKVSDDEFTKLLHNLKMENPQKLYLAIGTGELDLEVLDVKEKITPQKIIDSRLDPAKIDEQNFSNYIQEARKNAPGILIEGKSDELLYNYAKCCNPVPGDNVIGFVTMGEGIRIHRRNCKNMLNIFQKAYQQDPLLKNRILEISWPGNGQSDFIAGVSIVGKDRANILNDIAHAITTFNNTLIRSVSFDTKDSLFYGNILLYVKNLEHLNRLIDRLKKITGISKVQRIEE
jgi:GTP diphosphokinase / guanosine-3',5'-bis(diphosphate) 3'-diphosphatase